MKVLLVIAIVADLALAALLVGISGFVFGGGPEGMHGAIWVAIGWWAMFIAALAAPVLGVVLARRGKPEAGALIAWMPAIIGIVVALA